MPQSRTWPGFDSWGQASTRGSIREIGLAGKAPERRYPSLDGGRARDDWFGIYRGARGGRRVTGLHASSRVLLRADREGREGHPRSRRLASGRVLVHGLGTRLWTKHPEGVFPRNLQGSLRFGLWLREQSFAPLASFASLAVCSCR